MSGLLPLYLQMLRSDTPNIWHSFYEVNIIGGCGFTKHIHLNPNDNVQYLYVPFFLRIK